MISLTSNSNITMYDKYISNQAKATIATSNEYDS